MGVINFSKTNCQNCYRCVRSCPVKAIRVTKGQAEVIEARCIACGLCVHVCPKNAKKIQSELDLVKKFLKENKEVAVSLAPTYKAAFGKNSSKVVTALKILGFKYVEETVVGAEKITKQYEVYKMKNKGMPCITSCCESVNLLIQKYYPQNIPHLIPVISPMAYHSRLLKEQYGNDVKVVFIGPCLSKKHEGYLENCVDAVLTFDELIDWFSNMCINWDDLDETPFERTLSSYQDFPLVGGISKHIQKRLVLNVDGLEGCIEVLESINKGKFKDYLIEMNACKHGCIGGAGFPNDGVTTYERMKRIEDSPSIKTNRQNIYEDTITLNRQFFNLSNPLKEPTALELEAILNRMGKYSVDDQLNCGTCGYSTCKDKAIAIHNQMAEVSMCLPFLKQKAETFANILFDLTPNIVLIVDTNLMIVDFNPAAEQFFDIKKNLAVGLPVSVVLDVDLFDLVLLNKRNILGKKRCINNGSSHIIQSIVWVEYHEVMFCIINDITETVKKEEWMKKLKINAVNMAQEVINKQMRVAQEIASLLGETTAETKVTLTRLKELIKEDEVD